MKIRQGFVSNSSSSSFIALAFSVENEKSPFEKLATFFGKKEDFNKEVEKEMSKEYNKEEDRDCVEQDVFCWSLGLEEKHDIRVLSGSEDGVGEDDRVVALMLAETDLDSGDFGEGEVSFNEDDENFKKVTKMRDAVNTAAEIRVIYGTRCC